MSGKSMFFCETCGYESAKWLGKCPACNEWNTFSEVKNVVKTSKNQKKVNNTEKSEIISNIEFLEREEGRENEDQRRL